jgi:hypothetical protein
VQLAADVASPLLSDELEGADRHQHSRLPRRAGISATPLAFPTGFPKCGLD